MTDAGVGEPGTLRLRSADGAVLEVFDSKEHYESYQQHAGLSSERASGRHCPVATSDLSKAGKSLANVRTMCV